jgi:hypothetical protein
LVPVAGGEEGMKDHAGYCTFKHHPGPLTFEDVRIKKCGSRGCWYFEENRPQTISYYRREEEKRKKEIAAGRERKKFNRQRKLLRKKRRTLPELRIKVKMRRCAEE